jgi:DNA-binding transcriptional LysR family regulator
MEPLDHPVSIGHERDQEHLIDVLSVLVQLVAEGVGVALMPRSGREDATDVVAVPVTHPAIDRRIVLVWRPDATPPAARAFITLAREQLDAMALPAGDGHSAGARSS